MPNSYYDPVVDDTKPSDHTEYNSAHIDFNHKQFRKLHNTPSTSYDRHNRVHSWSGINETLYLQRVKRNLYHPPTIVRPNQPFHSDKHKIPLHGKKYVKIKSKVKTNRRFGRIVLAQTLSFGCTAAEVFASVPMTTKNFETEEPRQPLDAVWVVRFSKDGKYMATAGQSCIINVWKVLRDTSLSDNILLKDIIPHEQSIKVFHDAPVRIYTGHTFDILDLSWSKNNFLLSASMDKTVRLWHVSQATCLCAFNHPDIVTSVRFHPKDDRFFLSGCLDSRVRIWSIPEKRVAFWNEVPNGDAITAAGFTSDGRSVCVGTDQGDLLFYETQGLRYNTQISVKKHRKKYGKKVTGIEPMPGMPAGEERILVTTNDSRIWMINMKDKSCVYIYKGLQNEAMQIKASFSDDGRYIISGSEDGCVYMWCTDQVSYSPFQHWKDRHHLRAAANFYSLGDQFVHTIMQNDLISGEPSPKRMSSWLKKGERRVTDRLRSRNEHFDAHRHAVSAAAFAPLKTRQMLARAGGDIILDHTPVSLQDSGSGSHIEKGSRHTRRNSNNGFTHSTESPDCDDVRQEGREQFTYPESQILVSTDIHGAIKVWRMDSGCYSKSSDTLQSKNQKNDKPTKKRLFTRILSKLNQTL
ncbi:putative WD repeat-containing protein C3H5.08c [Choanephora cucurbitarum]|uniref:Putative WD repeat-containing protein C3H5.08c n=1 Tax=Choanephora cucurbitarum TaxID=101091 RepID=A0A1C7NPY4_9FUNG|nr:putative WD repeat-containing protein C3H5.08c [Choanephora cucurbitarum]